MALITDEESISYKGDEQVIHAHLNLVFLSSSMMDDQISFLKYVKKLLLNLPTFNI